MENMIDSQVTANKSTRSSRGILDSYDRFELEGAIQDRSEAKDQKDRANYVRTGVRALDKLEAGEAQSLTLKEKLMLMGAVAYVDAAREYEAAHVEETQREAEREAQETHLYGDHLDDALRVGYYLGADELKGSGHFDQEAYYDGDDLVEQ